MEPRLNIEKDRTKRKGSELTIDTLASSGEFELRMAAMPRPLRIQYSGARYHVMSRGDGARSEPPMDY
jgi:hypothetical protein